MVQTKHYSAVYQNSQSGSYYTEYVIDSAEYLSELPVQPICGTGSKVTVIGTGAVYLLNHQSQWILQP